VTGAAALLAFGLAVLTDGSARPPTDLELYLESDLSGLHAHPIGLVGVRMDRAERRIAHRRAAIRPWIAARVDEAHLAEVEAETASTVHDVYWTHGPTEAEEWATIQRARRALGRLESRRRRLERAN
jgi:hypothetical protein